MKKIRFSALVFSLVFVAFFLTSASDEDFAIESAQVFQNEANSIQIPFIENKGQLEDGSLKYYAQTFSGTVFVTEDGQIVYSLPYIEDSESSSDNMESKGWVIRERLVRPSSPDIIGEDKATAKVNIFKGHKCNSALNRDANVLIMKLGISLVGGALILLHARFPGVKKALYALIALYGAVVVYHGVLITRAAL